MASVIYQQCFGKAFSGQIIIGTDTIKVMLVSSGYTENKDHDFRSDVTSEVSGTGYTAGGATATCSVTVDDTNDRMDLTLGGASWGSSTITARKAVYYKSRGGAASADELLACNDFGSDVATTNGTFTLNSSTLRIQN